MLDRLSPRGRRGLATLLLLALAAWVPGPACGAPWATTGPSGHRTPDQDGPILGAALSVIADGTAPWEDRPIRVDGLGTLPGVRYADDPGDDVGPTNGVVRSGDAIVLRASFSVRGGTVEDLSAEVVLSGPAQWDASRLAELRLGGCPGGATILDDGHRLQCVVGKVVTPPSVAIALDLTARVSGTALQGDQVRADTLIVRATGAGPDPDVRNCPWPLADGCMASAPIIAVSAAPGGELVKSLGRTWRQTTADGPGHMMEWSLAVVLGADGDARGDSHPVGAPWVLPDWWRAVGPNMRTTQVAARLVSCSSGDPAGTWSCAQPGGPGTPVEVRLQRLDPPDWLSGGVSSVQPMTVASLDLVLWVPESDLIAARGDITFHNCFATEIGAPGVTLWRPLDERGQPNLGGLAEPYANNCSFVVLKAPQVIPTPTRTRIPRPTATPTRTPRPGRPGPGRPSPTPTRTATPHPVIGEGYGKAYLPQGSGSLVTDGSRFSSEVTFSIDGAGAMPGIVVCDKWDNRTQSLRDGGVAGVRVWWSDLFAGSGARVPAADRARLVVEYATGRWGRRTNTGYSLGRSWYTQAATACSDSAAVSPPRWVSASDIDFTNQGRGRIDARDVNMVRVVFADPVPAGTTLALETLLVAEANPPGTWLMNYGTFRFALGREQWRTGSCAGYQPGNYCPVPAPGTRDTPGLLGDMLYHVGVPLRVTKHTDPIVPGGSPVVTAPDSLAFVLEVSTQPRPSESHLPDFPPGAFAPGVVLTDTLPLGLVYNVDSARIASEDLNGNGRLDPGEDQNGNGRIDLDAPFEPAVEPGPGNDETTLRWYLGNLPYGIRVPTIRFTARASRLVRGGTAVINRAGVRAHHDPALDCRIGSRDNEDGRCAWAQAIIANVAAAQVEKLARAPRVLPGEAMVFRLALANLTSLPVEWFDAVDLLPRPGEPRDPATHVTGGIADVAANVPGLGAPIQVWASAVDPDRLDTVAGTPRDGLVDPVSGWGGPGAGLDGPDWPCQLAEVGTRRCPEIADRGRVTALRFWGPDPRPGRSGTAEDSLLPAGGGARWIEVVLQVPGSQPGDLAHNAWGGRFESLPLPVFADAVIRVRPPDTPTPTTTLTPSPTGSPTSTGTPTATAPPTATPTRTPTFTPTRTPTASDTPTPTATATAAPTYACYLPASVRARCVPRPVDVVLVIDASSSMLRPAGDGGTKQAAVTRAARSFLDRFAPSEPDRRVAVAAFHYRAWIAQPLTGDRTALDAALAGLGRQIAEGTRLDLGLLVGAEALTGPEPERWRAIVFLTDGMPNRIPTPEAGGSQEDVVLAAATAVRDRGITIFSVGYGRPDAPELPDRILPWLLRAVAGESGAYYQTDDAAVLAERFATIAASLECMPTHRWP